MQPTNEQVVAACQRAGIHYVCSVGNSMCVSDYTVNPHDDTCPGSALFIVAVLKALKDRLHHVGHFDGYWYVTWFQRQIDSMTQQAGVNQRGTLTAACMAAIVAAYPEQETTT